MRKTLLQILTILAFVRMPPATHAATWYLQNTASSWATLADWWSAPVGGTNPTAFSSSDTFHLNGNSLTTPQSSSNVTFGGGTLVMDGMTGVWGGDTASGWLGVKCSSATASITIPTLVCSGGPDRTIQNNTSTLLSLNINNLSLPNVDEITAIKTTHPIFPVAVGNLTGNGSLDFTAGGTIDLTVASATGYNGTIYVSGSTCLAIENNFVSSGALVVENGSTLVLNGNVTVTALVVSGTTSYNAGLLGDYDTGAPFASNATYTYAQLNAAFPAIFTSGSGSITVTQPVVAADASNVVNTVRPGQLQINLNGGEDGSFFDYSTPNFSAGMQQANIGMARIGGYPKHGGAGESLAALDRYVEQTLNAGAQPLFIQFINTQANDPTFMASLLNLQGVSGTNSGATIGTNCAYLVQHYMAPPFNLKTQYWEVGNEPDDDVNYLCSGSTEYINFYQGVHDQLVASGVRGNVKLCGPVVSWELGYAANGNLTDLIFNGFLQACAGVRNGYYQADVVTRHVYPYIYSWETGSPDETTYTAYNLLNSPLGMVSLTQSQVQQDAARGEGDIQAKMDAAGFPPTAGTGITEMNLSSPFQQSITQGIWFCQYDHYGLYNPRNQLGMGFAFDYAPIGTDWSYFNTNDTPGYPYWATYIHGVLTGSQILNQSSSDPHLLVNASQNANYVYLTVINRGANPITATVALNNASVTGSATLYQLSSTATPDTGTATSYGTTFTYTFPSMTTQVFQYAQGNAPAPPVAPAPPANVLLNTNFATVPSGMQTYSNGYTPVLSGSNLKITGNTKNACGAVVFAGQPLTSVANQAQIGFGFYMNGHAGTGFVFGAYSSNPAAVGGTAGGLGFYGQPNALWGVPIVNKSAFVGSDPDQIGVVPSAMDSLVDGWATRVFPSYTTYCFQNMYEVINYNGAAGTVNALLYQGTSATTGTLVANITNRLGNPSSLPVGTVFGFTGATSPSAAETTSIQNLTILTGVTSGGIPAPAIESPNTLGASVGSPISYQIVATNNPASYSATGLPAGLSVNPAAGLISGSVSTTGTTVATISAINASGTGSAPLTITILSPLPSITSALTAVAIIGSPYNYQITATDSPVSFNATALPAGLSVNTSTGVISGTPTATGTFNVDLNATTSGGRTGWATLVLTVSLSAPAPVITSALTATGTIATPLSYQIAATNNPTSYGASGLPVGLNINTSTGVISGTPNTTGTTSATISAINSGGTGSATLTIAVLPASQNPFETWEQTYFSAAQLLNPAISGDTACPFGDGIANLMKYALNLNPNTDGVSGLPVGEPMQIGGANYLTLKYTQVIAATDITYTVEVSGDLRTWNSGPGYTATVSAVNNPDGVTQTVIVQDLTPVTSGSMQFVRLRVTMP